MKIVVIGGTGLIGSKTVAILRQGGHEVVAASPKSGINSITGEGLKEAMAETKLPEQSVPMNKTPTAEIAFR
jgi:nucleoside-diphosphate-sugar epimerase